MCFIVSAAPIFVAPTRPGALLFVASLQTAYDPRPLRRIIAPDANSEPEFTSSTLSSPLILMYRILWANAMEKGNIGKETNVVKRKLNIVMPGRRHGTRTLSPRNADRSPHGPAACLAGESFPDKRAF